MASASRDSRGRYIVQFSVSGKRKTLSLGQCGDDVARDYKSHVAAIVEAREHVINPPRKTLAWITAVGIEGRRKVADVGLIDLPENEVVRERARLASFLDTYIEARQGIKPRTRAKYRSTRESLVDYFGAEKLLEDISEGDCDEWYWSILKKRAENTARKHAAVAKVLFHAAVSKRLLASNPFSHLKATIKPNESRFHFITREVAQKVLDACPDAEWRLIFALSRFGGLRCPSEHLALRWVDIDWKRSRITITSPKTEHHEGGGTRVIPLFAELLPYLEDAQQLAELGAEFVITRYRSNNQNLRTQLGRIIERAGLEPWPKLFQNLRSTRETELSERFPPKTVCKWLGNSELVASKFYLQVTDAHFDRAVQGEVGGSALQNALHGKPEENDMPPTGDGLNAGENNVVQYCASVQLAEAGLEPARGINPTGF
jgi:integrase